jgi:hypothetical protein
LSKVDKVSALANGFIVIEDKYVGDNNDLFYSEVYQLLANLTNVENSSYIAWKNGIRDEMESGDVYTTVTVKDRNLYQRRVYMSGITQKEAIPVGKVHVDASRMIDAIIKYKRICSRLSQTKQRLGSKVTNIKFVNDTVGPAHMALLEALGSRKVLIGNIGKANIFNYINQNKSKVNVKEVSAYGDFMCGGFDTGFNRLEKEHVAIGCYDTLLLDPLYGDYDAVREQVSSIAWHSGVRYVVLMGNGAVTKQWDFVVDDVGLKRPLGFEVIDFGSRGNTAVIHRVPMHYWLKTKWFINNTVFAGLGLNNKAVDVPTNTGTYQIRNDKEELFSILNQYEGKFVVPYTVAGASQHRYIDSYKISTYDMLNYENLWFRKLSTEFAYLHFKFDSSMMFGNLEYLYSCAVAQFCVIRKMEKVENQLSYNSSSESNKHILDKWRMHTLLQPMYSNRANYAKGKDDIVINWKKLLNKHGELIDVSGHYISCVLANYAYICDIKRWVRTIKLNRKGKEVGVGEARLEPYSDETNRLNILDVPVFHKRLDYEYAAKVIDNISNILIRLNVKDIDSRLMVRYMSEYLIDDRD